MALTLRSYLPDDFETLYEMDRACYPRGIAYSRRELAWYLKLPGAECLVAESGEPAGQPEIAGFIVTTTEPPDAHVITLDVGHTWRRKGVGTALLAAAERNLAAGGVREVALETATNNQAGVAFWQQHGYRSVGLRPRYYLGRIDAYAMVKRLDRQSQAGAENQKE